MPLLQWKPEYSVGVAAVDHEHRELIDLVNKLHEMLVAKGGRPDISDRLGDLFKGISAHFALEEQFMRESSYDELTSHKADHERLLDEIRDIMDSVEDDQDIDDQALGVRLEAWFGRHFETHDARLHRRLGDHPTA
jgi:hemerythrin-like metal-binding protein